MAFKLKKNKNDLETLENNFIQSLDKTRLEDLGLDELANRYVAIDSQAHMMKGLILLEARNRFTSNNEFGDWVKSVISICDDGFQVRNRLMNYAKFFQNKDTTGISLSSCYLISSPSNSDIANNLYQIALNQNLSVAQIKAEIMKAKGLPESNGEPELMPLGDISSFTEQVLADIAELQLNDAIRVLEDCKKKLKSKKS
ncbi:MAG: hypothetical protein WCJ03_08340 [Bacteroidales bacterium]